MAKSPWSDLSDAERMSLYVRVNNDEISLDEAADQLGMKKRTLARRLREVGEDFLEETEEEDTTFVHVDEDTKVHVNGQDSNNMVVTTASPIITSLAELLEFLKVDLDVWEVDHWIGNAWPTTYKNVSKELEIKEGRITGSVKQDGAASAQNIQIKAWLIRKQPVEIRPVVKPVHFAFTPMRMRDKKERHVNHMERTLVIPDTHFGFNRRMDGSLDPYHDRLALSIVLAVAMVYQFDNIIMLGDIFDFADFSTKFFSGPDAYYNVQPAVAEAAWFFTQLRATNPNANIVVLEGNHDERLPRLMREQLKGAMNLRPGMKLSKSPMLSVPGLLEFEELGIGWVDGYPNARYFLEPNLCLEHGDKVGPPGSTATKMLTDVNYSVIFGHIHRMEMAQRTLYRRGGWRVLYGFSPGFLGRMDGIIPGKSDQSNWSQGFAIVDHNEDTHAIQPVFVDNGSAVVEGVQFDSYDYTQELIEATEMQFPY